VDPFEPALSCIGLSPDEASDDDGYWFAREVMESHLGCELVVLSACETGRGRLERGEGVLGLTRAFLAAGSGGVVSSLWAVSDASTAELMRVFYQSMYDADLTPADALQRAATELRKNPATAHPFHWAAFVATTAR
jgi:CHAT domain-containing protein